MFPPLGEVDSYGGIRVDTCCIDKIREESVRAGPVRRLPVQLPCQRGIGREVPEEDADAPEGQALAVQVE